ncbi:glycoside hydrolase family 79 protein [Serpula lacrymans var. lacrymans S7.3]|uniref:Glycoside hydrolase family 79 protein n=1 Tax=Serpula lacrymans var. lacrymans (strain S7.3) TaxID=936435 RepID=F8PXI2_SERL3|nr:glycoside hydrolase family 79 protein [Serpula lacrymans var. lacrymans S7.3]
MFESNAASCGGFPGLSDSFETAYGNFSGAVFQVGGQNVCYNYPIILRSTVFILFSGSSNQPILLPLMDNWRIYYSTLIVAEAFGPSGTAQMVDLQANYDTVFTPAYATYEGGAPVRMVLMNYVTDPTGASDHTANFSIGGGSIRIQCDASLYPSKIFVGTFCFREV